MKVLIVDDEAPARERLRHLLEETGAHTVVGEAANGQQALELAPELVPDVVLLDIRMPGLSGMETARHLNRLEEPPAIIFATAYDEYAVEAFDQRAVGYVLKPVRRERLVTALEQAGRLTARTLDELGGSGHLGEARSHVCARVGHELKLIPVGDVYYFQADQKYVRVRHVKGDNLIDDSLKFLEREFEDRFVRIHRSALVAIARIEALEKTPEGRTRVRLGGADSDDPETFTISRRHLPDVRRRIKGR